MSLRISIAGALSALALAAAVAPAAADGMPHGQPGYGHPGPRLHHPARGWQGARRHHAPYRSIAAEAAAYGPAPSFAPPPSHAPTGPMLVRYSEPYIGRGLIYNVPPPPGWASHAYGVVSALN